MSDALSDAVLTLAGVDLPLLAKLSVSGIFDASTVAALGGGSEFAARLSAHPLVEPLAGETYRVREPFRAPLARQLDEEGRREAVALAADARPLPPDEQLLSVLASEPLLAGERLRERLREALDRWDVAEARRWLAVGRAALDRIEAGEGEPLREALQELTARVDTRSLWRRAWLDTSLYLEREATRGLWPALAAGPEWALQIVAPGGTGKTTFLRALIARHCVPDGVAVALLDFDRDAWRAALADDPPALVRALAEQLDPQLPGRPLRSHLGSDSPIPGKELGRIIGSAGRTVLIVADTTERLLVSHRALVMHLWAMFSAIAGEASGRVRLVLSGRHDLTGSLRTGPEVPGFAEAFARDGTSVALRGFAPEEAARYLREVRGIEAGRVEGLVRLASEPEGANGLKLSLLADLVLTDGLGDEIAGWQEVELIHLIQRVIARIEAPILRWVVRWGSLADPLTRALHDEVLWPMLVDEMQAGTEARLDLPDPARLPGPQREPFVRAVPATAQASWEALSQYVTETSWVRPVEGEPDAVRFHIAVREPMRRLLAGQPVVPVFHRRAHAWFAERAGGDPRAAAGAVYHAVELDPEQGAAAVARWLLSADPAAGGAARVAEVVIEARSRGRRVADAPIARAHAELAAAALRRGDTTSVREHLDAIGEGSELPGGLFDWLAGAIAPGDEHRLLAATASPVASIRAAAHESLATRELAPGSERAIAALRAALEAEPTVERRLRLADALAAAERHGEALALLPTDQASSGERRAQMLLAIGRAAGPDGRIPISARSDGAHLVDVVRRFLALGWITHAWAVVANEHGDRGRPQGLVQGAALRIDDALALLVDHPLDAARVLADAGLPDPAPEIRLRLPSVALEAPVEVAVLSARIGDPFEPVAAGGPTVAVRAALAAVIAGGDAAPLAEALAAVELPERRLVLLDGLADARAPELSALVPLVEACIGDAGLDPGVRATLALVLGWGGRREAAARMVREALSEAIPIGAIRPWVRVHRALGLPADDLPAPRFDPDARLPPGSPLGGVVWLDLAEAWRAAGDPRADEAFEQARARLASSRWQERLRHDAPVRGAGALEVEITAEAEGWRVRVAAGEWQHESFVADPDGYARREEPLRELAHRIAAEPDRIERALSAVAAVLLAGRAERVALLAAPRSAPHLPWELARWPGFVHRTAPASPVRRGARVLPFGRSRPEREARLLSEGGLSVLDPFQELSSDLVAKLQPEIVLITGTFALQKDRVVLAEAEPRHGDTAGRMLRISIDPPPLLLVLPDTTGLAPPDRWHQLLLRDAWCAEAALALPGVLGAGCVPDPLRVPQLRALADGLREAPTLRALVERLRTLDPDPTLRAVALWTADPDLPWSQP